MSLGGSADFLFEQQIPSPKGKSRWTQPVLSNILSNQKYIGHIVSFDDFFLTQGEKGRRSNIDEDTNKRKVTRYNSQSVLSGLLVCAECNHNYRRITRPSGEIIWRRIWEKVLQALSLYCRRTDQKPHLREAGHENI